MAAILDGTSNTLAFGEAIGGYRDYLNQRLDRDWSHSWIASGSMGVMQGLRNRYPCPIDETDFKQPYYRKWSQFSSEHPQISQFAFADGSVQPVNEQIDIRVFYFMAGMSENSTLDNFDN